MTTDPTTTPEPQPDAPHPQPTAILDARAVTLTVWGHPDIENRYGRGHLRPSGVRLDYRGRIIHARVFGAWVRDGEETDAPMDQHYDAPTGDLSDWPEWLAALAHEHAPTVPPPVSRTAVLTEAAAALTAVLDADKAQFPRRSNDRAALGAAREIVLGLIDKPSRMAAEEQPAEPPCCSDPTCVCDEVNAEGRCDCTKWESDPQADPTPLRWGLNDTLWGGECDDDTVTVLLSGPNGEPYTLELDPERAAVLREDLAGPDAEQAEPHRCDNCEGIDPDTCFTNPNQPPEQCSESEFDGYGPQCQKEAGHNLCTFQEQAAPSAPDTETADAAPVEPHPTQADMDHALAVTARFFRGRDDAPAEEPEPDRIVAYRHPDAPSALFCREHGANWLGLMPLTSEDLPDGGICNRPDCGVDVLIPQQAPAPAAVPAGTEEAR